MWASDANEVPVDERTTQHLLGVRGRATRAEPERGIEKVGLEDALKHHPCSLLDDPIPYGRDAKWPHTTLGLGDQHPADRQRAIAPP